MQLNRRLSVRIGLLIALIVVLTLASTRHNADTGSCGGQMITLPFTDVMSSPFFCQIAEAYFSGLANGNSLTTFNPSGNVTRDQMAAFTTRTLDQSLQRGSRRAALDQWWTTQTASNLGLTALGNNPLLVKSDGADLWATSAAQAALLRVRASDGKLLDTWTGANEAFGVLIAMGKVFVTAETNPGTLYDIDPTQPAGAVTIVTSNLGSDAR